ncbi:MAG TPA: choice-of-anchor D domain-containing protein, partial [Luteolibacter sp.]
ERIGAYAFWGCLQLDSVTIPKSVKSIGDQAFAADVGYSNITRLASAIFKGNAPEMGKKVFNDASPDFKVLVSNNSHGFAIPRWQGYPVSLPEAEITVREADRIDPTYLETGTPTAGFNAVPVGDRSKSHFFVITNVGNRSLTAIRTRLEGASNTDFRIVTPTRTSLAPGKHTTVEIIFSPKKIGKRKTTLKILSSDSDESVIGLPLSGIGVELL